MSKKIIILFVCMLVLCQSAFAGLYSPRKIKTRNLKKKTVAQATKTAVKAVDTGASYPVKNWTERRYDKNRDGYLQPEEAKALLKDRYKAVRNTRRPKVNTVVEAQFDYNDNGFLEKNEITAMSKSIN